MAVATDTGDFDGFYFDLKTKLFGATVDLLIARADRQLGDGAADPADQKLALVKFSWDPAADKGV